MLAFVKKKIQTGPNPLAQVAGRITESMQTYESINILQQHKSSAITTVGCRMMFVDENKSNEYKLVLSQFTLSANFKDKWILTNDQEIVGFSKMIKTTSGYFVEGQIISSKTNYFEEPFRSSYLHIHKAVLTFSGKRIINIDCIFCKLVAILREECVVFIPLIHTIN